MHQLFDTLAHLILSFYGRQVLVYFLVRGASDVGDKVLEVVGGLQLDFPLKLRHFCLYQWNTTAHAKAHEFVSSECAKGMCYLDISHVYFGNATASWKTRPLFSLFSALLIAIVVAGHLGGVFGKGGGEKSTRKVQMLNILVVTMEQMRVRHISWVRIRCWVSALSFSTNHMASPLFFRPAWIVYVLLLITIILLDCEQNKVFTNCLSSQKIRRVVIITSGIFRS